MKIIEKKYKWNGNLSKRRTTKYIVIHHAAAKKSAPDDIHSWHLHRGWLGIGYNFVVTKDGSVYTGRPIDCVGAHTTGYNSVSVGICFEGNFEEEHMSEIQKNAGIELVSHLKGIYPYAEVKKHKEFEATGCPGKYLPFDEIAKGVTKTNVQELTTVNDIVWELHHRGIMTNKLLWLDKCDTEKESYDLAFAMANKTVNTTRPNKLESENDIVWELHHRKLITDKASWLQLIAADKDLYWLAYKAVNMTKNAGDS